MGGGNYGGAFFLSGYSKDKIVIENSKIINNKARRGGGLAVQSYRDEDNPASLVIRDSIIADNTSTSQGGGLWTDIKGGVTIEDSTFSGNRIENSKNGGIGGAIVLNYKSPAKSKIINSTFVDNYAGDQAGSIWIAGKQQAKNLTISKSEFADNRSSNKELENTVNYKVTNGGGNVVQNINGTDSGIPGAKLVEDLQLSVNPVPQNEDNPVSNPVSTPINNIEFSPISSQPTPQTAMEPAGEEEDIINGIVNLSNVDFDGDGEVDEKVSLIVNDINSTGSYSNSAGFYQVLDSDGTVLDAVTNQQIKPGEQGYETAAFNQRIAELEFDQNDSSLTVEVDGGIFLAPYLIANGTVEEFIDKNPTNEKSGSGLNAYFAFGNANPDEIEHLKSSDNGFGFEDSYGGGDKNFSDLTFNVTVESA